MNPKSALQILEEATSILASLGVKSWLTDGTLLGYYREGNFLKHDKDVDIGILRASWNNLILPTMISNNFELIREKGSLDNGLEYSFKKNNISIDFFFFYEEEENLWHSAWLKTLQLTFNYPNFSTKPIVFLGRNFSAPTNEEEFLRIKYGESWATPEKKWNWAFSPKNVALKDPSIKNRIKFVHEKIRWKIRLIKQTYRNARK